MHDATDPKDPFRRQRHTGRVSARRLVSVVGGGVMMTCIYMVGENAFPRQQSRRAYPAGCVVRETSTISGKTSGLGVRDRLLAKERMSAMWPRTRRPDGKTHRYWTSRVDYADRCFGLRGYRRTDAAPLADRMDDCQAEPLAAQMHRRMAR
jgi:hypothetical protein